MCQNGKGARCCRWDCGGCWSNERQEVHMKHPSVSCGLVWHDSSGLVVGRGRTRVAAAVVAQAPTGAVGHAFCAPLVCQPDASYMPAARVCCMAMLQLPLSMFLE